MDRLKDLRVNLAAAVERLVAIHKIISNLRNTVTAAAERENNKGDQQLKVAAEVRFTDADAQQRRTEHEQQITIQKVMAAGTCIAAVAAIIYAGISVAQWKEMRKQTEQLQRQMRVDQRAWIQMDTATKVLPVLQKDQPFIIPIIIRNIGKTSATQIISEARVEKLTVSQAPSLIYEGEVSTGSIGVLFPNQEPYGFQAFLLKTDPSTKHVDPIMLSQEDVDQWNAGRLYLAIFGRVSYRDVFGIEHWTKYCAIFIPRGPAASMKTYTKNCSDYNDVDNN